MKQEELKAVEFFKDIDLQYAFDSLTKVLNREVAISYIHYLIEKNIPFTLGLCDVDNFKNVNDTYGHMAGDEVLKTLADTIRQTVGDRGAIGRFGGDEFIIVLPNITEYDQVWEMFHSLNVSIGKLKFEKAPDLSATITNGASRFPLDAKDYEELLHTADRALYRGKTKGRNCFIIYLAEKHANIQIQDNRDSHENSMEMITRLFDIMAAKRDFKVSLNNLLQFLSTYLVIDAITIDSYNKNIVTLIHPQCKIKQFAWIDPGYYEKEMNSIGLMYINARKSLLNVNSEELFEKLKDNDIHAMVAVKMICNGVDYGVITAKSTNQRVWQAGELDLFVVAAKVIAIALYYFGVDLEEFGEMLKNKK